jgi:two-component system, LytTR family, response regulator
MQKYFFIKINTSYVKIHFCELVFIEGARNYLKIITEKRNYLVLMSMKRMEQLLSSKQFVRIHRSYIVSLDHISKFDKDKVYLKDKLLPIGNQFKGSLEKAIFIAQDDDINAFLSLPVNYLQTKAYAG